MSSENLTDQYIKSMKGKKKNYEHESSKWLMTGWCGTAVHCHLGR